MKKSPLWISVIGLFCLTFSAVDARPESSKTALLIIDIQNFYFPGGDTELVEPEAASLNAKKLLEHFRKTKQPVIHVRHNYEPGGAIRDNVKPVDGEKVISKNYANSFKDTDLLEFLRNSKITKIVICGMQTHMCVEAAARAAKDLDFDCVVAGDACATRDLKYGDKIIKAEDVHLSTLSTLKHAYAAVTDTEDFLKQNDKK